MALPDNPTLNHTILRECESLLFDKPRQWLRDKLQEIIRENSALVGNMQECFIYRAEIYGADNYAKGIPPRPANLLRAELSEQMQAWLRDKKDLEDREMPYVLGYLQRVMYLAQTADDFLALLPDCLHGPVRKHQHKFPIGAGMDAEARDNFLEGNQQYLSMVKERMASNLLL